MEDDLEPRSNRCGLVWPRLKGNPVNKNLINFFAAVTAAIAMAMPANAEPAPRSAPVTPVVGLASVPQDFDSQWAVIDSYINAHVQFPSDSVRQALKTETWNRYATWVCGGGQLGWPGGLNSNGTPTTLTFDCPANAETCAQMILSLVNRTDSIVR